MLYHVIIALNSIGKRKIGKIVSAIEKNELEFVGIRKRVTSSKDLLIPNLRLLVVRHEFEKFEAMKFYRERFSDFVLNKKLDYFFGNHLELFFESGEIFIEPQVLSETIRKDVFPNDRKFPLMFVVTTCGGDGVDIPFIPDMIDMEILNMNFGTLGSMFK